MRSPCDIVDLVLNGRTKGPIDGEVTTIDGIDFHLSMTPSTDRVLVGWVGKSGYMDFFRLEGGLNHSYNRLYWIGNAESSFRKLWA